MKKLILCASLSMTLFAPIYEIKNIAEITRYIAQKINLDNNEHPIVIFDIDDTLIKQYMPHVTTQSFHARVEELENMGLSKNEALNQTENEHIEIQKITPLFPVETTTITLFNELQKHGISPLGLTARSPKLIDYTHSKLLPLGIDFTNQTLWPEESYIFENFERPPHYVPGIIFTHNNNKGIVLQLFLEKMNFIPHVIIFIDDVLRNLKAVEDMANRLNIDYIGLHYKRGEPLLIITPTTKNSSLFRLPQIF